MQDARDRASISEVCRRWYELDRWTRRQVTIAMCYAATPQRLHNRKMKIERVKLFCTFLQQVMALTKSLSFSLGRKRILISNNSCDSQHFCEEFECFTPMKKLCSPEIGIQRDFSCVYSNSLLQALPQELLEFENTGVEREQYRRDKRRMVSPAGIEQHGS